MSDIIDFHNHVIPDVDDGASDEAQSAAALHAFLAQGISQIIATPHVDASLAARGDALQERLAEIDAGWARLEAVARAECPDMTVLRGAEIMLDTPEPHLSDARLRLNGGTFVLVEYPFMAVPPQSARVLRHIIDAGHTPVVAHPERYSGITPESRLPAEWRATGALLQVNAGSLTGRYGDAARSNALSLLAHGQVDYICSDYHARGRPSTGSARRFLSEQMDGAEQAELLTVVNPRRLIEGERPIPVAPLRQRTGWDRLFRWIR